MKEGEQPTPVSVQGKNIKDYLFLYLGCDVEVDQSEYLGTKQIWKYIGTTLTDNFHFINVVKNGNHQSFHRTPVKPILRNLSDMPESDKKFYGNRQGMAYDPLEFIYLLKQGYDLFNLIPQGLAIDKTKLENNGK